MNTRKLQKGRGRDKDFNFFTFTILDIAPKSNQIMRGCCFGTHSTPV